MPDRGGEGWGRTLDLLLPSGQRRRQAARLLAFMLAGATAEFATILATVPFVAMLASPHHPAASPPTRAMHAYADWASLDPVLAASLLLGGVAVAALAVRVMLLRAVQRLVFDVGLDLSIRTYANILHQPLSFHLAHNSSGAMAALQACTQLTTGFLLPVMQAIVAVAIAAFVAVAMLLVAPLLALALIGAAGLAYVGIAIPLGGRFRRSGEVVAALQTARIQLVQEGMGGVRDILIGGAQATYLRRFAAINGRMGSVLVRASLAATAPRQLIETAGLLCVAALAIFLSRQAGGGLSAALPQLGALALGVQKLVPLFGQVFQGWAQAKGSRASVDEILYYNGFPQPPRVSGTLPFRNGLELRGVRFAYPDGPEVLRGVDLVLPRGAALAVVGRSGSGKTTLLDVVLGLQAPSAGGLYVDGRALLPGDVAAWQANLAHVPQTVHLADVSIAENIAFGVAPDAVDRHRLHDAVAGAGLADVVGRLPQGLETRVGEHGVRFSGGQRQRIGIARALYRRAGLLVLDEATSALDAETEEAVMTSIMATEHAPTILVATHRPTALRRCSRVYRLVDGRLVDAGAP